MKPKNAIKARLGEVTHTPSQPARRAIGLEEALISSNAFVRHLYAPGELEGGRKRATDPIWSMTTHTTDFVMRQDGETAFYRLTDGPARSFVCEGLFIVPDEIELPHDKIIK